MRRHILGSVAASLLVLSASPASPQERAARTAAGCPLEPVQCHACAVEKMRTFNPPRTANGQPNVEGYWNRSVTSQDIEAHGDGCGAQAGSSVVIDTPDRRTPYQPWALEARNAMGDSRGHWDGNTLVVEVTNANGLVWLDNAGNFVSNAVRVAERFTLSMPTPFTTKPGWRTRGSTAGPGPWCSPSRGTRSPTSNCSNRPVTRGIAASRWARGWG